MSEPWRDWFHCIVSTYGTWLRGDPRGYRTRHHREHCEGDYKNPPPKGTFDKLHEQSKRLMKREQVYLALHRQQFVVDEVSAKLLSLGIPLVLAILDDHHLHLLARITDHRIRHWVGMAKKHSSHMCREFPDYPAGGLWAKKCDVIPIEDQSHEREVFFYLLEHHLRGGALWIAPELRAKLPSALKLTRARMEEKRARKLKRKRK